MKIRWLFDYNQPMWCLTLSERMSLCVCGGKFVVHVPLHSFIAVSGSRENIFFVSINVANWQFYWAVSLVCLTKMRGRRHSWIISMCWRKHTHVPKNRTNIYLTLNTQAQSEKKTVPIEATAIASEPNQMKIKAQLFRTPRINVFNEGEMSFVRTIYVAIT